MMLRRNTVLPLLLITVIRCSIPTQVGGGNISDTGNVVAIAAGADSIRIDANTALWMGIYSSNYIAFNDSGFADTTHADSGRPLVYRDLDPGRYTLIFRDSSGKTLLVQNVPVYPDSTFLAEYDTLYVTGTVSGLARSIESSELMTWSYAFIPGTPYYAYTGYSGSFVIPGVPPGTYRLQFYGYSQLPPSSNGPEILLDQGGTVVVKAGETTEWGR